MPRPMGKLPVLRRCGQSRSCCTATFEVPAPSDVATGLTRRLQQTQPQSGSSRYLRSVHSPRSPRPTPATLLLVAGER